MTEDFVGRAAPILGQQDSVWSLKNLSEKLRGHAYTPAGAGSGAIFPGASAPS